MCACQRSGSIDSFLRLTQSLGDWLTVGDGNVTSGDMITFVLRTLYQVSPRMSYDVIRKNMGRVLPFNTLVGIEIVSLGDGVAEAVLPFRREVTNHIESTHASALFALAEAASGAAMSGAFAPVITAVRPVATEAKIEFLKTARTKTTARAQVMGQSVALRDSLESTGKAVFDVQVIVTDEAGTEVARVKVGWHVGQKR
jgi:uncharacterized protein (TIGR00369 family)